jgi:hypothetical protein
MAKLKRDPRREHRIEMEIVVDAYGEQERAMAWYYYLQTTIRFPFTATCIVERPTSPLNMNDAVKVIGMPGEDLCEHDMLVKIRWETKVLAVPLSQLHPTAAADKRTRQAVGDWHYWVKMGYQF